jgi:hypothetical protein
MTAPRLIEATATLRAGDPLCAEIAGRGVTIAREISDAPYRMRDFDLLDPEGNRLCFGEPIERVDQTAGATAL